MAKKGEGKKLKRLAAPKTYTVKRKEGKWVIKIKPSTHPKAVSVPLGVIIRDYFKYAQNIREVKWILKKGLVKVDGKVRKDYGFAIGPYDIIEFNNVDAKYYAIPSSQGRIIFNKYNNDVLEKPVKIKRKLYVKGGKIMLGFNDGTNVVLDEEEGKRYKVNDGVIISLPERKIKKHIPLKEGVKVFVIQGRNVGKTGEVIKIEKPSLLGKKLVEIKDKEGNSFSTVVDYIIPVDG